MLLASLARQRLERIFDLRRGLAEVLGVRLEQLERFGAQRVARFC